mmetsp:Transcript_23207/g.28534  ORF Transcript_23207/g.28534 Transcript_23207/m.28534 type:complete len:319 (+) Transcript_23207:568-1524(+)
MKTKKYPVYKGVVTNWDEMEMIWHHTFYNELRVSPEGRAVLLTEPPLYPRASQERTIETMFNLFGISAYYKSSAALLSLYAVGATTGIVLTSGEGVTSTMAVYEGYALPHTIIRSEVAGREITEYLMKSLIERGYEFTSAADRLIVQDIKEKCSYIALDLETEKQQDLKNSNHAVMDCDTSAGTIRIGHERFQCPEALFDPSLIGQDSSKGIHLIIYDSIERIDADVRSDFYANIVLCGGSTLFAGIDARLVQEIEKLENAPSRDKIKIHDKNHLKRLYSTWIGGSILASVSTFKSMWITESEFVHSGPTIVHRKCFS